jgi:2-keto-4-pentenoate hydratase/2-oxohepta-3-ene-1,7-dioic acid hydratase (catechol pathway)
MCDPNKLHQQDDVVNPGDVISTGTPPGVGMGMKPPRFLKVGDVVTLGADGLGQQTQKMVAWNKL